LYNPTGEGGHQGGGVAAPVGGQILSEVLPYLELQKDDTENIETSEIVSVPNIVGLNINDATKTLKDLGLELELDLTNSDYDINNSETIITEQTPKEGIQINSGEIVFAKIN